MSSLVQPATQAPDRIVLVTGANKGLGYATAQSLVAQGYTVYIGARNADRGKAAAGRLDARFVQLDVTDDASVDAAMRLIAGREGRLDILVNNAGVMVAGIGVDGFSAAQASQEFDTNAVGVVRVTQAALPLLRKSVHPVVVNVASGLGSFWAVTHPQRFESHYPMISYVASKAAVAMLTVQYAKALPGIKFNAVEPGFTATEMTAGWDGGQPVAEGARVIVRMTTIGRDGPTGAFESNTGPLPW